MIAPDETTFAYLRGPSARAGGRRRGTAPSSTGARCATDDGATFDTEVVARRVELAPYVTWGTNPGRSVTIDGPRARPGELDAGEREAARACAAYMALEPGTAIARRPRRHGLHRLVHELADRGPARGGARRARAARCADGLRALVVPGSRAGQAARPRRKGSTGSSWTRGSSGASAGCSMCLGMNPDILGPASAAPPPRTGTSKGGRARAAERTSSARAWRRPPPSPGISRPRRTSDGTDRAHRGDRAAAGSRRRRHGPDHPRAVPEADRADRLRRVPVRRMAQGPRLRPERRSVTTARRSCSRGRTSAADRAGSTRLGRSRTTGSAP